MFVTLKLYTINRLHMGNIKKISILYLNHIVYEFLAS